MSRRPGREEGFATAQLVVAAGLGLLVLVVVANLLVDLYARGAVRHALTEGVRAGVPVDVEPAQCRRRAEEALVALLPGPVGRTIQVRCRRGERWVEASARVQLRSWLPGVPDWAFTERAVARRDP